MESICEKKNAFTTEKEGYKKILIKKNRPSGGVSKLWSMKNSYDSESYCLAEKGFSLAPTRVFIQAARDIMRRMFI